MDYDNDGFSNQCPVEFSSGKGSVTFVFPGKRIG